MKTTIDGLPTLPASNPDHHIWNNNGTWWCHFTVHKSDYTAERVRVSLRTRDLEIARQRRNLLMAAVPSIAARLPRKPASRGAAADPSPADNHGPNL
jgi:hypothetical protein